MPAAVGVRATASPAGWVGAALKWLSVAGIGVKLIAMAWAWGARLSGPHLAGAAVAYPD